MFYYKQNKIFIYILYIKTTLKQTNKKTTLKQKPKYAIFAPKFALCGVLFVCLV